MSNWVVNPDSSVTVTLSCTFDGSYDAFGTGTATIVITPQGGQSTLAALLDGDPGMPANIRNVNVTEVSPTTAGSGTVTQVSPGGPGTSSVYDLNLWIPQGTPGAAGGIGTIMNASDLTNAPTAGYVLSTNGTQGTWVPFKPPASYYDVTSSSFTNITGTSGTSTGVSATCAIAAQNFRYRPIVTGCMPITSAADTWIDVQVMMGVSTQTSAQIAASGTQVAYGVGQASASTFMCRWHPAFNTAMTPSDSSPAAAVAVGTAQTIVVSALRQYGTSAWSTAKSLNTNAFAELQVELVPV